jgi:hypothetical protein
LWKGLGNCRKIILSEKVRTIVTNFCEKGYWSSVDIKGKILIISVYIQGLVVMLNLGSRNVWINGRCCVLVNHDFTPNNLIFSHCGGRRENFWGISFEKSRFCAKKIIFFPILGGARTPPPFWICPCIVVTWGSLTKWPL